MPKNDNVLEHQNSLAFYRLRVIGGVGIVFSMALGACAISVFSSAMSGESIFRLFFLVSVVALTAVFNLLGPGSQRQQVFSIKELLVQVAISLGTNIVATLILRGFGIV